MIRGLALSLFVCLGAVAGAQVRFAELAKDRILLILPKDEVVLRDSGAAWGLEDLADEKAFEEWRLSLPDKPEVSAIVDRLQRGKLGKELQLRGSATVKGSNEIEFSVGATSGNLRFSDEGTLSEDQKEVLGSIASALAVPVDSVVKSFTGKTAASQSGADWVGSISKLAKREPPYLPIADKAILEVKKKADEPTPAQTVTQKPADKPSESSGIPIWVYGGLLGAAGLGGLVGFFVTKAKAVPQPNPSLEHVSVPERNLLEFFRQQAKGGAGSFPNSEQKLVSEITDRFNGYPALEGRVEKAEAVAVRLQEYAADSEKVHDRIVALTAEIKTLTAAKDALTQERDRLARERQQLVDTNKGQASTINAYSKQIEELHGSLREMSVHFDRTTHELRQLEGLLR